MCQFGTELRSLESAGQAGDFRTLTHGAPSTTGSAVVVITLFLIAPGGRSAGDVAAFVYGIFFSLFVFFNCFAINMFLQYKRIGPWRNYVFGEYAYIVLSLAAKSALDRQVFSGTLS